MQRLKKNMWLHQQRAVVTSSHVSGKWEPWVFGVQSWCLAKNEEAAVSWSHVPSMWSVTKVNAVWQDRVQYNYKTCVVQSENSKYLSSSNVCSFWMQDQKARMTTEFLLPLPARDSEVYLWTALKEEGSTWANSLQCSGGRQQRKAAGSQ